ncbi:unnamed protein product [Kluyveromyces dobzhanskii CBS 2104]|uniref:Mitochondrial genome maintenance protein MGM101 n=1 Tax=Kluyveromyces dobzhanskii CBS 2104 TaxID=1427455 RepID=A0A0A8L1R9_9SACH|nr:unnamed protein product [Kluyveromyces dobzhanskii CBS 2104]
MLGFSRVVRFNAKRFATSGSTMVRKNTSASTSRSPIVSRSVASSSAAPASSEVAAPAVSTVKRVPGYGKTLEQTLNGGVLENPAEVQSGRTEGEINWYNSYHGVGSKPFSDATQDALSSALNSEDIEIKPDGLIYLPEIKYRRVLNKAFGPGGWGLVPRSETIVTAKLVTREYALVCHGQLVSIARGEQDYFSETGIPTATEGCKSNALMRCCKDLGIGSELWDPVFIKQYKKKHCTEKFVEHVTTKKKKKIWLRKDREVEYPYK